MHIAKSRPKLEIGKQKYFKSKFTVLYESYILSYYKISLQVIKIY